MRRVVLGIGLLVITLALALAGLLMTTHTVKSETVADVPPRAQANGTGAPTEIEVYALARGGRFIGDDIGGAQVTLRDAITGEFLASGRTRGGSGTADLMTLEQARTSPTLTDGAAVFTATLMLDEPRLIQVEAFAPLGAQGSANRVTATEWVVPATFGENKIIMEVPGLNVEVVAPPTHFLPTAKPPLQIQFRVNVTMICGCPIGPSTVWKPQNYAVKALIHTPDGTRDILDLQFDGNAPDQAPSQFIGTYTAKEPGIYEAVVFASQAGYDNAGSDRVTFILP